MPSPTRIPGYGSLPAREYGVQVLRSAVSLLGRKRRLWALAAAVVAGGTTAAVALGANAVPPLDTIPGSGTVTQVKTDGSTGWDVGTLVTTAKVQVSPTVVRRGQKVHFTQELVSVATVDPGKQAPDCPANVMDETIPYTEWVVYLLPGGVLDPTRFPTSVGLLGTGTLTHRDTSTCNPFRFTARVTIDLQADTTALEDGCYAVEPRSYISGGWYGSFSWHDLDNTGSLATFAVGAASCTAGGGTPRGSVVGGTVTVQTGSGPPQPLTADQPLPVGATVDATLGAVRLVAPGKSAVFSKGAFRIASRGAVSEIALAGGDFSACKHRKPSAVHESQPKVIRRLWGDGKGRFRTRGRFAAATVRGTAWDVEDTCAGTVVHVRRGVVEVRALRTGRLTVVRAGGSVTVPA